MKQYTLPDGNKITSGSFKINGFQFPPNWFDLATSDDLSHWGIAVEEIQDPTPQVERRRVAKSVIVDRLYAAGKLDAARATLDAADTYTRERWNTRVEIYADDPTAIALLQAIGANPNEILAP